MSEKLNRMLRQKDKGVSEAVGVLSKLWRQILWDLNIGPEWWSTLMVRYLSDKRNGIRRDVSDKSSARGNLNKALNRPRMTWKVFRQGLRFLDPQSIEFMVVLKHADGRKTVHRLLLDDGPVREDDAETDIVDADDMPDMPFDIQEPVEAMNVTADQMDDLNDIARRLATQHMDAIKRSKA